MKTEDELLEELNRFASNSLSLNELEWERMQAAIHALRWVLGHQDKAPFDMIGRGYET